MLANYYISEELSLEFGPQLGFLLAAKYKDEEDGEKYEEDVKEFFKSTDFGLNFGLGYQLKSGIGFNARYTLGVIDIFDYNISRINDTERTEENGALRNKVFNIRLFYTF